jgi:sterol desaturase/sphingolipid hydroxylase (fatty acid hydroxylase superfamily)
MIMSLVSYVLLGYGLDAAAWTSFWVGVFDLWEHTNIKTPHWLGYFIVRPEMHRVHHEKDRHRNNYGLPLWDMIFGTYENSMRSVDCGFSADNERNILSMIIFRNVDR